MIVSSSPPTRCTVLVTGGAGYIGSHMLRVLTDAGHACVTLDNLSTGHRDAVRSGAFVHGDVCDTDLLDTLFQDHPIDAVMHFAGLSQVGESVRSPGTYYRNNVCGTLTLLDAMVRARIHRLVFSSTAAIFGEPDYLPVDERHPQRPLSPYGRSKWMVEQVLRDYDGARGVKAVCLRYFNAAGAHSDARLGERHAPETHLIPLLLRAAAGGHAPVPLFGRDYDTPDGTCIRDYVHVLDLCQAHLLALDWLVRGGSSASFNLGNGAGHSVLEVIRAVERVTGRRADVFDAPRRPGDPARLVADSRRIRAELGWQPRLRDIERIVGDAWAFERSLGTI